MSMEKPIEVLIIEDNPGDALLISELLETMGLPLHVTLAQNGQQALNILGNEGGHPKSPIPDFVILDLNLPKVHGFEVLAFMKSTPALRTIPVVVMTGSLNKEDEKKARAMGVTDYRIKPSVESEFDATRRWLRKNIVPLDGKGQMEDHQDAPCAALMADTRKRHMPDRRALRRDLPSNTNRPGLGDWSFRPFR